MKTIYLFLILFIPGITTAQIIDDSSIDRIQNGEVEFMKGEFVAYLADTTSPDFVRKTFNRLDLQISSLNIDPLTVILKNYPSDKTLNSFKNSREVSKVLQLTSEDSIRKMIEELEEKGLTDAEISRMLTRLQGETIAGTYQLVFQYNLSEEDITNWMTNYPKIAYELSGEKQRTINIRTEPGSEKDVMSRVDELPFVKYTALIGMLRE